MNKILFSLFNESYYSIDSNEINYNSTSFSRYVSCTLNSTYPYPFIIKYSSFSIISTFSIGIIPILWYLNDSFD